MRNPIRGIFVVCCAVATAPHIANAIMRATIPTNFRFWIFGLEPASLSTGFRFPIGGWTHEQLKPKDSLHLFDSLNRKPVVSYVEPSAIENLS